MAKEGVMFKVIWKYPLEVKPVQDILLPYKADILCVQMQYETPTLWALVNPQVVGRNKRRIILAATGSTEIGTSDTSRNQIIN